MIIGPHTAIDILEDNGEVTTTCTLACYGASNKAGIDAGDCPSVMRLASLLAARPIGAQVSLWSGYSARISERQ